ncbi:MAG: hypothetical protein Kow0099_21130 [Candidatus Abyssubacteria bacterium]
MRTFTYRGIDRHGRSVSGSTVAQSEREVRAQLVKFGFSKIQVTEETSGSVKEQLPDDYVQKLVDGDIAVEAKTEEEVEEDEWRRAEVLARARRFRKRENVALVVTVIILGCLAAYFIFDRMTALPAPEPTIIADSTSELLRFKEIYIRGNDLIFVVYGPRWNGNVRVDFQAWDPFEHKIDFGTARLGFIGDYYGGSAEKSGVFKLKKRRFYERIELLVSGDEGK